MSQVNKSKDEYISPTEGTSHDLDEPLLFKHDHSNNKYMSIDQIKSEKKLNEDSFA